MNSDITRVPGDKEFPGYSVPENYGNNTEAFKIFEFIANKAKERSSVPVVETDEEKAKRQKFEDKLDSKDEHKIELDVEKSYKGTFVDYSKVFIFDIETSNGDLSDPFIEAVLSSKVHKGLKDPVKIKANREEKKEELALDPMTGEIILTGFFADGMSVQIGLDGTTEKVIITDTCEMISSLLRAGYIMVTYGGKEFDLPYLFKRALKYGIRPSNINYSQLVKRYVNHLHIDLYEDIFQQHSQSKWSYFLGLSKSWENDGKMIPVWFKEGKFSAIKDKNLNDIKMLQKIYSSVLPWIQ